MRFLRRSPPRRPRARRRGRLPHAFARRRGDPGTDPQRRLALDGLQALLRPPTSSPRNWVAARRSSRGRGSSSCVRDEAPLQLPLDRIAPARQPRLPRVRRGGLSPRVAADRPAVPRTARVHVRPGARDPGGPGAAAVARSRRQDAAQVARPRRGDVLRDVLLRVGHAVLPGSRAVGPRRPDADATRAGAVFVLARVGARAHPPAADRHRRRARGASPARREEHHANASACATRSTTPWRSRCLTRPGRRAG